jgi:putative membrane protein
MSVLSWMAMLFYLPRLFVYHAENKDNKGFVNVVKIQEMKLYRFIGTPAMVATLLSGVAMIILNPSMLHEGWLHAKLLFLVGLIVFHFDCGKHVKLFANDSVIKEGKFYRFYNEIPTLLMIGIVIFVIVKPF